MFRHGELADVVQQRGLPPWIAPSCRGLRKTRGEHLHPPDAILSSPLRSIASARASIVAK
jgi:hypothetical protein